MSGNPAYFVGQGLAVCSLWWPLCFLAFRGTYKRNYSLLFFGTGYFLASLLTTVGIFINHDDAVTREAYSVFIFPLLSSMVVLFAYTYLWGANLFSMPAIVAKLRRGNLNGWQRIGVVLSVGWVVLLSGVALEPVTNNSLCPNRNDFWRCQITDPWSVVEETPRPSAYKFPHAPEAEAWPGVPGPNVPRTGAFDDRTPTPKQAAFLWDRFLLVTFAPVIFLWGISYLLVWLFKWIWAGFKQGGK